MEGCYIPFDWQKDFEANYLSKVRYICLCFSEEYIEQHFAEIKAHGCDIEARLDASYCTMEVLKRENQIYKNSCEQYELPVVLIERDYESIIAEVFN